MNIPVTFASEDILVIFGFNPSVGFHVKVLFPIDFGNAVISVSREGDFILFHYQQ